jgi:hypothetical protein
MSAYLLISSRNESIARFPFGFEMAGGGEAGCYPQTLLVVPTI